MVFEPWLTRQSFTCNKTLVKPFYVADREGELRPTTLAYEAVILIPSHRLVNRIAPDSTFDFANFLNLEEVTFEIRWSSGVLLWIPRALSTLKLTTSPRLSVLKITPSKLHLPSPFLPRFEARLKKVTCLVGEVARVEREFIGVVEVTMAWGPKLQSLVGLVLNQLVPSPRLTFQRYMKPIECFIPAAS